MPFVPGRRPGGRGQLTYRRTNHSNILLRGYEEIGAATTPFDRVVLTDLDRVDLVGDVIDRLPALGSAAATATTCPR